MTTMKIVMKQRVDRLPALDSEEGNKMDFIEDHLGVVWKLEVWTKMSDSVPIVANLSFYPTRTSNKFEGNPNMNVKINCRLENLFGDVFEKELIDKDCNLKNVNNVKHNFPQTISGCMVGRRTYYSLEYHVEIRGIFPIFYKPRGNVISFATKTEDTDLELLMGKTTFFVNKKILCDDSSYFSGLLSGAFVERGDRPLRLRQDPLAFQAYLEIIHGKVNIDDQVIEPLVILSNLLVSKPATDACEYFLTRKSYLPLEHKLELARDFDLKEVENFCLKKMEAEEKAVAALHRCDSPRLDDEFDFL